MKPNLNQLLKQAQKMQEDLQRVQESLVNILVDGTSGGGMVKVTANAQGQVVNIEIDPEVITPDDKEMLEDLVVAAVNQALENAKKRAEEEMAKVTGNLMGNMPGGFKLPGM